MWSQLLLNIQMMPSLNMCGFLYSGADIGGFGGDTTQDLLLRWLAFGIFTPLMRNHSAIGTRRQEVYQFSDVSTFRNLIGIRYSLMPYIYSEFMKAAIKDECYFRPLAFDYTEDEAAKQVEDQLLVGESIMIAPVYIQNATGRYVYLPEAMKMIRMQSDSSHQEQIVEQGHHYIKVGLDEIVFFIRPDHIVPYCKSAKNIKELDDSKCQYMSYLIHDAVEYELYRDDGIAKDYSNPQHYVTIHVDKG